MRAGAGKDRQGTTSPSGSLRNLDDEARSPDAKQ